MRRDWHLVQAMKEYKKDLSQVPPGSNIARLFSVEKLVENKHTEKVLSEKEKQRLKAIWHGL